MASAGPSPDSSPEMVEDPNAEGDDNPAPDPDVQVEDGSDLSTPSVARPPTQPTIDPGDESPEAEDSDPNAINLAPQGNGTGREVEFELPNVSEFRLDGDSYVATPIPRYPERRLSQQLAISGTLRETPLRRSNKQLIADGRRQSLGLYRQSNPDDHDLYSASQGSYDPKRENIVVAGTRGLPIIDGRIVNIATQCKSPDAFIPRRLWDKRKRNQLTGEAKVTFIQKATGYIFAKNHKLRIPELSHKNEEVLAQVQDNMAQVKSMERHLIDFDLYDVMTAVIPIDLAHSPVIENRTYSILYEHSQLHPVLVANSNTWYNIWVTDEWTHENLVLTFDLLKNNTDPHLWDVCMEAYDEFTPVQQGGPLMLYLILSRIRDSSEQALDYLKAKIAHLEIRKLPGEDVEQAVSLIRSTHTVLKNASTRSHSYVPIDFVKNVVAVFTTSSVGEFNDAFIHYRQNLYATADMRGVAVEWPPLKSICLFALAMYRRLKAAGIWDSTVGGRTGAYLSQPRLPSSGTSCTLTPRRPGTSSRPFTISDIECWNCGEKGHGVDDCKKPRNEQRIQAARKKYFDAKRQRRSGGSGTTRRSSGQPPKRKVGQNGYPMILNKNGAYVVDQKLLKTLRNDIRGDQPSEGAKPPPTALAPEAPGYEAGQAEAIRSTLRDQLPSGL